MTCHQNTLSAQYPQYIYVQSRCTGCISLNVTNFFIGSKLHTYLNIAMQQKSARWRLIFDKGKFNRNTHTRPRERFQKIYRFPCLFIVQNHTYNIQMSLQLGIHIYRISSTFSVCFEDYI